MNSINNYNEKRKEFDMLFNNIDEEQAKRKNREVLDTMDYVYRRIDYTEQRRFGYLQTGIAILAFSGAGGAIIATLFNTMSSSQIAKILLYFLIPFIIGFFITGILTVIWYNFQTNPKYPFIDVTKTWKWFYHYMDIEKLKTQIWYRDQERHKYNIEYLNKLRMYADKTINKDIKEELKQNVEQLYLYLVLEKFKNDFTRQLQRTLIRGVLTTTIGSTLFFIICALSLLTKR